MSSERPTAIGPYRILDTLGEGGMGTVYLAEQSQPVKRRVALKLVKLGMDSKAVVARFEQERQALAMMQHDGIAKVFDCGMSDRGQPFFVMELVKGEPLTGYCDRQRLSLPQRITLMQQVCDAVQHAHQKGVVHRDLKPGNVLVTEDAGRAQVKIIDFGLAKAMGQKLVEATLFTEAGQVVGTPEYMAPEQADPTNQDIDTRADVYSLGVMLYEVLTGQLPFAAKDLRQAGLLEMQRVLREVDPPKPSTKLSAVGESATAIAEQRRIGTSALLKALRSDLDWLVLKSIEKDRARRYETANALKMDLQRFLDHEPLVAGPPSAAYRLKKVVRRYRGQMLAGTAVLATAVIGAVVAAMQAAENATLANEKTQLLAAETKAKDEAVKSGTEAKRLAEFLGAKMREYDLLAGAVLCDRAIAIEKELWPPWPNRVAAMEEWLSKQAAPLLAMREPIRQTITRLRAVAVPQTEGERIADQRSHPRFGEWQELTERVNRLRKEQPAAADRERAAATLATAATELAALTTTVNERRTWRFQNVSQRVDLNPEAIAFLHDTLVALLTSIDGLEKNEKPSVEQRLTWAKQVRELSLHNLNARHTWAEARAAIASNPNYAGQTIELRDDDVIGLVPIGENPVTHLWEFYELRSAWDGVSDPQAIVIPTHRSDGSIQVTGDTGIVFALLPGGTFQMGAQNGDADQPNYDPAAKSVEAPTHEVVLAHFLISRYEMTQGQWARLCSERELFSPSEYNSGLTTVGITITLKHPVENVSWMMCDRLLSHYGMTLPSEAQWEYSCRGGTTTPWAVELRNIKSVANLADWTAKRAGVSLSEEGPFEMWQDGNVVHAPVASYLPNNYGLYDMLGNILEWCEDWYGPYGAHRAGDGAQTGDHTLGRCARGGAFNTPAGNARSAARHSLVPTLRGSFLGCRAARKLAQ